MNPPLLPPLAHVCSSPFVIRMQLHLLHMDGRLVLYGRNRKPSLLSVVEELLLPRADEMEVPLPNPFLPIPVTCFQGLVSPAPGGGGLRLLVWTVENASPTSPVEEALWWRLARRTWPASTSPPTPSFSSSLAQTAECTKTKLPGGEKDIGQGNIFRIRSKEMNSGPVV